MILIILTLLPALAIAGGVLFAPETPFAKQDGEREDAIKAALGFELPKSTDSSALPEGQKYVVQFKKNVPLAKIEETLFGIPHSPLAESEQRLFAVSSDDEEFFAKRAELIDYYEPDLQRESLAATNDPIILPVYESTGITQVWDTTKASESIIVAVLDTGVDRRHEELAGINLLAGYDAVTKTAGVDIDSAGHGTGVIGIIAAQADNGLGIAGVAHGVTVLPIKVSSSSTTIYSSDLIAGIRFAADAGAKIINMSVGGYSSSYAEQEAVNYAYSKGCILVSAAGNGGNRPYADQKSYPASYDNVISVASCNENGERSDFSQYNDAVDVAVNGEMLVMPFVDELGTSVYRTDSGTSYSCAIVSGIAALAATRAGDVRFGNDEFISLIISACGSARSDELGYGIINAYEAVRRAALPIITGVTNNGVYSDSVRIGYNRGVAFLDGEPFDDGERVMANGLHILRVTDAENEIQLSFTLDYDPLSYEYKEYAAFSCFEFDRGTALLDGFPYSSGERITSSGRHEFRLIDGEEIIEKTVFLRYALPEVRGIENGGFYTTPIEIAIIGEGYALLDGKEIYGEAAVCESGIHTLTVKSPNGAVSKEYSFEISFDNATVYDTDYSGGIAAIDEENGYFCLYGESLVGARIYDLNTPEKYLHFLPIGQVYSHSFTEEHLILFGEGGISIIDRKNALFGFDAVEQLGSIGEMSFYIPADDTVFGVRGNSLYKISLDGVIEELKLFDFEIERAFYSEGLLCIMSANDDRVYIYDIVFDLLTSFEPDLPHEDRPACFGEGFLAIGNTLWDTVSGEKLLDFCSTSAVRIENGLLFTDNRIIDIASGSELGSFCHLVSDICVSESGVYLFGVENVMTHVALGADGVSAYGAAERVIATVSLPETITPYRTDVFYTAHEIVSAKTAGNNIYFLISDSNRLYGFDCAAFGEIPPVALRYTPKNLSVCGGYIAVSFENSNKIFLAPQEDISSGAYISLPDKVEYATVANGRVFAISGGKIAYCRTDGGGYLLTSLQADLIDSDGERIYALSEGKFTVYNSNLSETASILTDAEKFTLGSGIAIDGGIYDLLLNAEFARLGEEVLALRNGVIVTEKGVYSLSLGRYIGSLGIIGAQTVVITEDNHVVSFGDSLISVCRFENGVPVVQQPVVSGVEDGGIYIESTMIEYDIGIGYLDGKPFESGSAVYGAGRHSFLISLPCGQSVIYDFTIEANIESIEFLVPERIMSVGETITLRIKYNPEGASSVPVVFSCDSEGVTIGETGEITANKVGEYTVRAVVTTDYGSFYAECKITVRDDLLVFGAESGIKIDRNNSLILGVSPVTDAKALLAMLSNPAGASITDKNGDEIIGAVGTGAKMTLTKNGAIADSLTVVVSGDCDGDGYITAYDLYLTERILRGYPFDIASIAAADMNGNGIVADNDYRLLRNKLLRPENDELTMPEENLFGIGSVQTYSYVESGSVIDIAVCISGCKYARGVSGILEFGKGLEFISAESLGWEIDAKSIGDGKISFYAYGDDGENCEKAFKVLLNLRFLVTAEAGSTISIDANGFLASFQNGCKTVHFEGSQIFVHSAQQGELDIKLENVKSFEFDPQKYTYSVIIPYNSALTDITVTRPEGTSVSVKGAVIDDTGIGNVEIIITDANGVSTVYTLNVRREEEPRFDTNCRLSDLEIEGARLSPQFDPDILRYSVQVPVGTDEISIYCVAQNPSARIIISDTKLNGDYTEITVTVVSPDGESLVYTLEVTVAEPEIESEDESLPVDESNGPALFTVISAIGALVVAAIIIVLYIKLAKRDEEIRSKEE